jgi:hypothetical protein
MRKTSTAYAVAIGTVLVLSAPAPAGERAGVKMPDTHQVAGRKLVLNGLGVREATMFNVDVYVAGLYLEQRSVDAGAILASDGVKVLHIRFVRDVDRDDVVSAFTEGFDKNAGDLVPAIRPGIRQFTSWMPSFDDGSSITLTYVPDEGTRVAVNGRMKGTIQGADFARALFSIWLGPKPPNGGLKRGLLGR